LRIAHIITGLEPDGAETMLYKLLANMNRGRFEPMVVSLVDGGPVASRIADLGVPVAGCGMQPGQASLGAAVKLAGMLRRFAPEALQGWMYHGNLAAQVASALLPGSAPVLWNIRGSHCALGEEKLLTAATIWLGARLSRLPFRIVSNSLAAARLHERKLHYRGDRWTIIPNGFETERFKPSPMARAAIRAELRLKPDAFLVGLVGRYHPVKDHANFLKAAAILRYKLPGAQFVLAGAGVDPANRQLYTQLKSLGLLDCAHLLGARTDIPRVTAALDIAGSSSYSEAFPNVIGEAMSCGVPCVVTDTGDSSWLVGDTGITVPPRDPRALAAAWLELAARGPEGRQALGAAARERILERFSIGAIAAQYEKLYEQAVESRHAGKGSRACAA
jgi:glycosyltransferase involved in cell wall biosynthesis